MTKQILAAKIAVMYFFNRKPQPTEHFSFSHNGRTLNVTLRRRKNTKRLTMRVRDGGLALSAPLNLSGIEAERFIKANFDWVDRQLKSEEQDWQDETATPSIWYHGDVTQVYLHRDVTYEGATKIKHEGGKIIMTIAGKAGATRPALLLENWLKAEAKATIRVSLEAILPRIDQSPVPLSVRDQKTRWGSCSTSRRLSFNWRLIMAPPPSLHYVVVHEASHLIHHDHSKDFWGLVEELMPDFRPHQDWLKHHQKALFTSLDRRLAGLEPRSMPLL